MADTYRIEYNYPNGESDFMSIHGDDNAAQFKQAIMTNKWNYLMSQQQNDWNIGQWNRENAYNSPGSQVQRLIQAGINPLLLDVQGNRSASSPSASGASASSPGYTPQEPLELQKLQQLIDSASLAQNSSMAALQYQNELSRLQLDTAMNEEQLRAVRSGVDLSSSQRRGQDIANKRAYADYTLTSGNDSYRNEFLNNMRYQNASSKNLLDRQQMENDVYRATMRDMKRLPNYQIKKLLADLKVTGEQGRYLEFQRVLRDKYHIDPNGDVWTNLLYMGLRDPDSYNTVISSLFQAFGNVLNKQSKSVGDKVDDVFNRLKSKFGRPSKRPTISPGLPYYSA